MALIIQSNVTVEIYRTADPASPYNLGTLSATVKGYLKPDVEQGRLGSAEWLKWTHQLYLDPVVDIRDAYNSQLDPARDNTLADIVVLYDTAVPTRKTAFYVVFVEQVSRGHHAGSVCAFLDRFQPEAWPTSAV